MIRRHLHAHRNCASYPAVMLGGRFRATLADLHVHQWLTSELARYEAALAAAATQKAA